MGTAGYMSPEQVRGKNADARSDIFAFGAILYEMLSGKRAFHGETSADTMSAILKEDPPQLSETGRNVPPGLERIVNHCLEKNPAQRFQSASDVAFDLESMSEVNGNQSRSKALRGCSAELVTSRAASLLLIAACTGTYFLGAQRHGVRGSKLPSPDLPPRLDCSSPFFIGWPDDRVRRCPGGQAGRAFHNPI